MARMDAAAQVVTRAGITPSYAAVDAGLQHKFTNTGRELLHVKNTNGSTRTVTLKIPRTADGAAAVDKTVTIPATTGDKLIGPFPKGIYNQTDDKVYIDFSAAAGVTFAVVQLPAANA